MNGIIYSIFNFLSSVVLHTNGTKLSHYLADSILEYDYWPKVSIFSMRSAEFVMKESGMNYVKIPESMSSDYPPTEIPVFDSHDTQRGLARYYYPYGYRVALLPDFDAEIFREPQTHRLITDSSGNIIGIKITILSRVAEASI